MKMRTAYFKVPNMEKALAFWRALFQSEPCKKSPYWSEFRCDNINLALLWMENFEIQKDQANFVPVFELNDSEFEVVKSRALLAGASIVVDVADHPDKKSYVLADVFGNEFEITRFHDEHQAVDSSCGV
ncbi:MAG: VOC family protein [Bdellovibrionales bacterium]